MLGFDLFHLQKIRILQFFFFSSGIFAIMASIAYAKKHLGSVSMSLIAWGEAICAILMGNIPRRICKKHFPNF